MLHLLRKAGQIALGDDERNFLLGAIGIRQDGVSVSAKNGAVISSTYDDYRIISDAHAECRVIRKLGKCGVIYVARVLKKDGTFAMARPCGGCQLRIRAAQTKKVYYTINNFQYGIWHVERDCDIVYSEV